MSLRLVSLDHAARMSGFIGGPVGYKLLRRLGRNAVNGGVCDGRPYRDRSKLEVLFGSGVWDLFANKTVADFGCGIGSEVIDIARHGARRAIGIDIRNDVLEVARKAAREAGVEERCEFVTHLDEPADVVISIDSFEHFEDPPAILKAMRRVLRDDGTVLVSFGPPWYHPYGGHLFSVFPWAHLIFTERALIRWRSDFKTDGARRFGEVAGGLNQMTVRQFEAMLAASDFDVQDFEAVPIRRLRGMVNPLAREFLTSVVRCTLVPRETTPR
jgi:SAM-dependent methyltransferase